MEKRGKSVFAILYWINLLIIIGSLLSPIIIKLFDPSVTETSLLYYSIFVLLGITFCVSFLGLNIWAIFGKKENRIVYAVVAIVMIVWVILSLMKYSANVFP